MTEAPLSLQELRRRIYRKAKSDKTYRFWGLFVHVPKEETLEEAYRIARKNGGAPGIDGRRFEDIEIEGAQGRLVSDGDQGGHHVEGASQVLDAGLGDAGLLLNREA